MTVTIGRRELLAALGGAAVAWPGAALAQTLGRGRSARAQQSAMPVVGFLHAGSPRPLAPSVLTSELNVKRLELLKEVPLADFPVPAPRWPRDWFALHL
jgi:soluble lytic murein transglycosylase-like protein